MPTAYVHIRETPHYRRDAFLQGLSRLDFDVVTHNPDLPLRPEDAVVVWNKTGRSAQAIRMARQGGAAVLVAENGYYGRDENHVQRYSLALDAHNGSGRWFSSSDQSRLHDLSIAFQPLRVPASNRVLVAAQRGIGSPLMRSPPGWEHQMAQRLAAAGFEPRIRPHPGTNPPVVPLENELADCAALAVWSSNCATAAIIAGVPTFYDAPAIITAGAARPASELLAHDFREFGAFSRPFVEMAWAQWTVRELTSGEPFRLLLDVHAGRLPSCRPGIDLA